MEELPDVIGVITIVVDPDVGKPRLDIGTISPLYAYTILKSAADAVYDIIPSPTVVWNNEVVADFEFVDITDIDDDDDDWLL